MAASSAPFGAKLKWGRFSPAYRKRLMEGALALDAFLRKEGVGWELVEKGEIPMVDDTLEAFVREMHRFGKKSSLRVAKLGVLFMQCVRPRLKRNINSTWTTIRSWEEQKPSGYCAPLPVVLLAALVCLSRKLASELDGRTSDLWYRFSSMLTMGFFGLLRPGEMFKLQSRHVTLPNSLSLGSPISVIQLEQPKNSRAMGRQQFAVVAQADAINWLSWMTTASSENGKPLWPSTPSRFRLMFRELCEKLGIANLKLSPASLRAGGATWMLDMGIEISKIRFAGRWSNLRSLEHYLQLARSTQISLSLSPHSVSLIKSLLMKYSFMLTLPEVLAATVPKEHLVVSRVISIPDESHVVSCVRLWSELAGTVQEGSCGRRCFERGTLP